MTLRPATRADFDAIADLFEAGVDLYDELEFERSEMDQWLTSPRLDVERDIRLYEEDGRLLAYVDVDPLGDDPVMWWSDVRVHPEADVAAVVPSLLSWAASRAGGGLLRTWAPSSFTALTKEFERAGMRRLRGSYRMEVDLDDDVAIVTGKGRRPRTCPFGSRTAQALDRYLRARSRHPHAQLPALWLGANGRAAMTDNGIAQMIRKRGRDAGIEGLHPHMLRHTFAHAWLAQGGGETDLMRLAGWKSRQMLNRYGASAADQRAREAHRHHGLGDRL